MRSYSIMLNRRNFIKFVSSSVLFSNMGLNANEIKKTNKSVIQIFLAGGATAYETWYANPAGIDKARSVTGYIQTKTPNVYFGGNYSNLAGISDKLTVVNSFGHNDASHSSATHYINTGMTISDRSDNAPPDFPSRGSMISSILGPNQESGIPTYVGVNRIYSDNVAWLPKGNAPYESSGDSIKNLSKRIEGDRFNERKEYLYSISRTTIKDRAGFADSWDKFQQQTYSMLDGDVKSAFSIESESVEIKGRYGDTKIGKDCLLARRLVENGSVFVSIVSSGWDNHVDILKRQNEMDGPFDKALSALINDIHERGLQNDVLIVVNSEFGRTLLNQSNGRDHAPGVTSLLLSGGKFIGGAIGQHDNKVQSVLTKRFGSEDLTATIYDHLGIDYNNILRTDSAGRPRFLLKEGDNVIS